MNSKWYISTLIIILALIGLNQEQTKVANQQIVLQFTETEISSGGTHDDALATITLKLEAIGIANIEVIENDNTKLSIRYYSDIDANSVGEYLSKNNELSLSYRDIDKLPFDFPEDELPETCNLVVVDLQQQFDNGLSLNGKFATGLNEDLKRFSNPVTLHGNHTLALEQDAIFQIAYIVHRDIALAIDKTSHSIPEVRAGPYVYGNS